MSQYAQYNHSPDEPAGLLSFPITPATCTPLMTPAGNYAFYGIGPSSVSSSADTITCTGHKFKANHTVTISNVGGGLPGGLAAQTVYWIVVIDTNTIQLATTLANAEASTSNPAANVTAGTVVNITSAGTGTQTITRTGPKTPVICRSLYVGTTGNLEITVAGDCVQSGILTAALSSNTFNIPNHGFITGDRVMVAAFAGGSLPTGISANTDYYVIVVDGDDIQLATSLANAQSATAMSVTGPFTGSLTIAKTTTFPSVANGYHPLAARFVNVASSPATGINGLV